MSESAELPRFVRRHLPGEIVDEIFAYEAKIDGEWGCCCSRGQIERGGCPNTDVDQIQILRLLARQWRWGPGFQSRWDF
ncbi:hypothetical protein BJP40_06540 [Streptomyces sp. CC53]|uniref:hypothetical protein n=1 Tax=Streptomyces sp. CC53 TaxID=1906740 RepID=UPI0008DCAB90|nr:hypothetical protein [Streptomyces sp. CC53]OII61180.1 hypothetical protein BJP40_06540 [Streptomyces sp. CC53]